MITLPLSTNWNVCTPDLFRYLPKKYVDSFFNDGSLRLSSFSQFHRHEDEERLDQHEGDTLFVHRTGQNGGQTITAKAMHGLHAYVLCAAMRHDEALRQSFGCDSYFRVSNSTAFGMEIARSIPNLVASFEGPCLYQVNKIIEKDLGYIEMEKFSVEGNPNQVDDLLLSKFINEQLGHYPLFLKDRSYAHQCEYRFVWMVKEKIADFLDLKVPNARIYCTPPRQLAD